MRVRDASSGAATYLVRTAAARRMLGGDELDVVELLPGRSLLSIACVDYRDNDLGDYNEVSLALFVRERAAPAGLPYLGTMAAFARNSVSTYIYWLPVDQSFTREAGARIWGFPKTVEEIRFRSGSDRASCTLTASGKHVLTLAMARGGKRSLPESTMSTYTYIDGVAHRTVFRSRAEGVGMRAGGAELSLGDHPTADILRELGLPKRPLLSVWMEHMSAEFEAPQPL